MPVSSPRPNLLAALAAFAIVVGSMKIAAPLLVPLLLALFISIITAAPYAWLHSKGVPWPLALLVVLAIFIGAVASVGSLIGVSASEFSIRFPLYQARLQAMTEMVLAWLDIGEIGISIDFLAQHVEPAKVMQVAVSVFSGMQSLLANSFLIMLAVVFILLEAPTIPDKWRAAHRDSPRTDESLARFRDAVENVNHYMAIKVCTSLLTGLLISAMLWFIGVDYPLLWGVMAFLLNFVPNIGSIIAAIPVVLLALVQLGVGACAFTALGYLIVNIAVGSVLEPRMMGRGLGLSTLVVFMSLILWGWVLGPVGMLLSVPLTIALKIALDSDSNTRWMAVMLGPPVTRWETLGRLRISLGRNKDSDSDEYKEQQNK